MHNFTSIFSAADGVGTFFQNKVWKRLQMFSIYFLVKAVCNFTQLVKGYQPYGQYVLCRIDKKLFWLLKFIRLLTVNGQVHLGHGVLSKLGPRLLTHRKINKYVPVCWITFKIFSATSASNGSLIELINSTFS